MKTLTLSILAAMAAINTLQGAAFPEVNAADGTIASADGLFTGRDFSIPKDFKMELLMQVPTAQGSWVSAAWDNKKRLIVAGYNTDVMHRLTIPKSGSPGDVQVDTITTTQVGASEGLLYAFGGIYMNLNRSGTMRSGLYKLTDTNNDDKYDKTEVIRNISGGGDHGTHALRLAPDGQSIFLLSGNQTRPTEFQSSRIPKNWGEDMVTLRLNTGFMANTFGDYTNGGYVTRLDKDGKNFELYAMGQRNAVDFAFNKDGELFTYDSDMEWDMGAPWYRPTNVQHITSGADFGFRSGARVHPQWHIDILPYVAPVGSGSPVGTTFGTGTKFPARYQDAMYIADWSYGNLHVVFMNPQGSSYTGTVQPFISGRPFAITGLIPNPDDGSLIVFTGGMGQTQLYRISYTGNEVTTATKEDTLFAEARNLRRSLEKFHGRQDNAAVAAIWPHLSSQDRFIRYAARIALEWQDQSKWRDKALAETDPRTLIASMVALARLGGKDVYSITSDSPQPDKVLQSRMIASLNKIDVNQLPYQDKLDLIRAYSLAFIRMGPPDAETRSALIAKFDPLLMPVGGQRELNWESADLLAYLDAPGAPAKMMALIRTAPASAPYYGIKEWVNPQLRQRNNPGMTGPAGVSNAVAAKQEDQLYYAQLLRTMKNGWTPALREEYLKWLTNVNAEFRGGNQFGAIATNIRADAVSQIPEAERASLQEIINTPMAAGRGGGGRAGGGGGGGGAAAGGAAAAPAPGAGGPTLPAGRGGQ